MSGEQSSSRYDYLYPTFRPTAQVGNGLGGQLRRDYSAAMPDLWAGFDHDWIDVRRGRCSSCGKTFTFLPWLSLPYTHYSLLARCQALSRRFVEHCSWEQSTPTLKDPDRAPDSSTLRRWSSGLDRSQPRLSFVRQTLARIAHWTEHRDPADHETGPLSWVTPALQTLWPLRR